MGASLPPLSVLEVINMSVDSYLNQQPQRMVSFLRELVEIRGVTGETDLVTEVAHTCGRRLTDLGAEVRYTHLTGYGDLVEATLGTGPNTLLCVGHTDIINGDWVKSLPWRDDGTRLHGPGVLDMKSGLVILIFSLEAMLRQTPDIFRRMKVKIVLNPDEEDFSPASGQIIADAAKGADAACIFEPARNGACIVGRKGCGRFVLRAIGRAAHAGAEPEKGINAIEALAHKVVRLRQLSRPEAGITVSTGLISGGTAANVVPESAEATVDVRVSHPEQMQEIELAFQELTRPQEVAGATITVSGGFMFQPWPSDVRSQQLFELVAGAARDRGVTIHSTTTGAGSDGNNTSPHCPTIDGMGAVGAGVHSSEEYVETSSLVERAKIFSAFVAHWLNSRPTDG